MSSEPSTTDQNVTRALRANLQGVQRQSEELQQAIADLVAACSSNRPSNALPHLLRAGGSAASLAAVLEVLAKFVAGSASSQPSRRAEDRVEEHNGERSSERPVERASSPSFAAVEIAHTPAPNPEIVAAAIPAPPVIEAPSHHQTEETVHEVQKAHEEVREEAHEEVQAREEVEIHDEPPSAIETAEAPAAEEVASSTHFAEPAIEEPSISPAHAEEAIAEPVAHAPETISAAPQAEAHEPQPAENFASAPISESSSDEIVVIEDSAPDASHNGHVAEGSIAEAMGFAATQPAPDASLEQSEVFDIASLPAEQQEMHRRANRVAKVSMQDIQLLRPDLVQQGRVTKDICIRLKDEIEKARREYERRFRPILGHGADYFYFWMVEVLGAGDAETLGEYPYHAPVLRH
jgi:hypothetical protein